MAQPPSSVLTLRPVFALPSVGERPCRGEPVGAHIALSDERVESSSKVVSEGDIRFVGVYLSPALQPRVRLKGCLPFLLPDSADALVLMTAHRDFAELDLHKIKNIMRTPIIVDGRRCFDPETAAKLGFTYKGVGAANG